MAIFFDRVPKHDLGTRYTHVGLFYGFVPVYIGDPFGCPDIAVRNGWPDWLLDLGDALFGMAVWANQLLDPTWENPGFFFKVTGEIVPDGQSPQP